MPKRLSSYFYLSVFYNRLLNKFCKRGKKEKFEILLQNTFLRIARYSKTPVFFYFFEILEKQLCYVGFARTFKKKRLVLVPRALLRNQQYWFACTLLYQSIINFGKLPLRQKIYLVFLAYFTRNKIRTLSGIKKKIEIYKFAIEKKSLMHYRW